MIESGGKTPKTYDYPGQATPGFKTKVNGRANGMKAKPTPTPTATGRQPNPRGGKNGR